MTDKEKFWFKMDCISLGLAITNVLLDVAVYKLNKNKAS